MPKVSIEVEVPKTCSKCKFYRKRVDRWIDHCYCTLGSYSDCDGTTHYGENFDNKRHPYCKLAGKHNIEKYKEENNKIKKEKQSKRLLNALQSYCEREFDKS